MPTVILKIRGDEAVGVRLRQADGTEASVPVRHRQASREFARLLTAYPDGCIAWYDESVEAQLSPVADWPALLQHGLEVLHLSCFQRCETMVSSFGYVQHDSPFLLPGPTDKRFGTWLISPLAGIGRCELFRAAGFDGRLHTFALALFDVGYRGMQHGLCPYSDPRLLRSSGTPDATRNRGAAPGTPPGAVRAPGPRTLLTTVTAEPVTAVLPSGVPPAPPHAPVASAALCTVLTDTEICRLTRRLMGRKWVLFWLAAQVVFERRLPLLAACCGLLARRPPAVAVAALRRLHPELKPREAGGTVSAIVPTLGRPEHVLNLLQDLAAQTCPPTEVILVEQEPRPEQASALAATVTGKWPFTVRHHFVRWVGACRARNLAMAEARGDWLLFLDDDVRLPIDFVAHLRSVAEAWKVTAVNAATYNAGQQPPSSASRAQLFPWATFGTCTGLVRQQAATQAGGFDLALEGGFGEDYEFGVRLRQTGTHILYDSSCPVLHLKASAGGFRWQYPHAWINDVIQPRPSPTVLYSRNKHVTVEMQHGFKLFYWLRRLSAVPVPQICAEWNRVSTEWAGAQRWALALAQTDRKANTSLSHTSTT